MSITTGEEARNVLLYLNEHESSLYLYISDEDYELLKENIKLDDADSSEPYPTVWKTRNGQEEFKTLLPRVVDAAKLERTNRMTARQILRCFDANPQYKELINDDAIEALNREFVKTEKINGEQEYPEEWAEKDAFEPAVFELVNWLKMKGFVDEDIPMETEDVVPNPPPEEANLTPLWNAKKFATDSITWVELFKNPRVSHRSLLLVAEVYLQEENSLSEESLFVRMAVFALNYPDSSERLKESLEKNKSALLDPYLQSEKSNPAQIQDDATWKHAWVQNPNAERYKIVGVDLLEADWNNISFSCDPHDESRGSVQGKILYFIRYYAVVWLPPLPGAVPGEERIILVKKSDHEADVARFSSKLNELGLGKLKLDPQKPASLKGRTKNQIKIINYACASVMPGDKKWPFGYLVGYDVAEQDMFKTWSRSMYNSRFKNTADADINLQRKRCGIAAIIPVPD